MKRYYFLTAAICAACLLIASFYYDIWNRDGVDPVFRVGFLCENDESTPYTFNFLLAQNALTKEYGERVKLITRSNVQAGAAEEPLRELAELGCAVIFTNTHSDQVALIAGDYPDTQFCQVSFSGGVGTGEQPSNYHSFNGRIYEGEYISGLAAGMKLRELLDAGALRPEEALVGFVGTGETPEAISGFTAFLLGVRAEAPEATMRVRYTGAWSSYSREKACAEALIAEGCVVIAQNTGTIGPAVACETAAGQQRRVFHVGCHQTMLDVAPSATLTGARVNWTPYITGAVGAVLEGQEIERSVAGNIHGRDMVGGFDLGWVEMLELNEALAAEGTAQRLRQAEEDFRKNRLEVFRGNYVGVNPGDSADTCDLNRGYPENSQSSAPGFRYILRDVITVEK